MVASGAQEQSMTAQPSKARQVGCLIADLPAYCKAPPIEVVVFGWGVTEDGQLGLDDLSDVTRPSVIESLLGTNFSGFRFNRRPIVAGSRNTLAVTETGRVLSWGWNDRGTLGVGHRRSTSKPTAIEGLAHEHVVQVAAGGWHCLAVTQHGQIYAWGGNEYFQCGVDAGKRDICIPKLTVPFLKVQMVSCGGMHSVALTTSGDVWQWGEPWGDFSMDINRSPRQLDVHGVESIASGAFHNLALTEHGQVVSWGTNDFGQLGTGDTTYYTQPKLVQGLEDVAVADIGAGGWHSLVLSAEGHVYTWGRGEYGRLGLNDPKGITRMRPCLVPCLENHRVVQAACGGSHTMVLTDAGRTFIWGRCSNGRMGSDVERTVEAPTEISLPGGAERWQPICIALGGRHSMCMALPRHTVIDHERRLFQDRLSGTGSTVGRLTSSITAGDSVDGGLDLAIPAQLAAQLARPGQSLMARSLVDNLRVPQPVPQSLMTVMGTSVIPMSDTSSNTVSIQPTHSFLHRLSAPSELSSFGEMRSSGGTYSGDTGPRGETQEDAPPWMHPAQEGTTMVGENGELITEPTLGFDRLDSLDSTGEMRIRRMDTASSTGSQGMFTLPEDIAVPVVMVPASSLASSSPPSAVTLPVDVLAGSVIGSLAGGSVTFESGGAEAGTSDPATPRLMSSPIMSGASFENNGGDDEDDPISASEMRVKREALAAERAYHADYTAESSAADLSALSGLGLADGDGEDAAQPDSPQDAASGGQGSPGEPGGHENDGSSPALRVASGVSLGDQSPRTDGNAAAGRQHNRSHMLKGNEVDGDSEDDVEPATIQLKSASLSRYRAAHM